MNYDHQHILTDLKMAIKLFLVIFLSRGLCEEVATRVPYTTEKGKNFCPCHFFSHPPGDESNKSMCVGIFPLQAATATDNDTLENKDIPDDFSREYVERACQHYGQNVTLLDIPTIPEARDMKIMQLPIGSLFVVEDKCAYVKDTTEAKTEDCKKMLEDENMEYTLCKTPALRDIKPICRCPCGFMYSKADNSCVGVVSGCEPFDTAEGMFILSYSVLPTVAMIARLEENYEAPADWPNGTIFFVGDPAFGICGYKNASVYQKTNCSNLFTDFAFYSVLLMAPSEPNDRDCPKVGPLDCGAIWIRPPGGASWYTLIFIWALTVILADDKL